MISSNCARRSLTVSVILAGMIVPHSVGHAASLFWSGDGNTQGGMGSWDTQNPRWGAAATGPFTGIWSNAALDTAIFGGTAGAVDVVEPITAGGLTFLSNGYSFTSNPVQLAPGAVVRGANTTYSLAGVALAAGNTTWRFASSSTSAGAFANANVFRISEPLSGNVSVAVSGTQPMYLTSPVSYTGGTIIAPGAAFGTDTSDVSQLPTGSIIVGANSHFLRRGQNLNNAVLQLIDATSETFTIYGNNGGCANALDLSGTNGGVNLPNASLAFWDNAGTRTFAFTGTITPGSNGYRFGGSRGANIINLTLINSLTGTHALTLVPGSISRLRIHGSNDFTGDTTVHASTLFLLNGLGLQNSAINTAGAGKLDVSGNREGLTPSANAPFFSLTIGGLKGSADISQVFNASYTAPASALTSLTLNPGDGATHSYSGIISDGAPGMSLAKTGGGTQILSGANTFTGATLVSAGTLGLGATGSIATSASVTIAAGATLDTSGQATWRIPAAQPLTFGIDAAGSGSAGRITAAGLDITSAVVTWNINGTPDDPAYVLATYTPGSLTGSAFQSVPAPPSGYALDYAWEGDKIALVRSTGGVTFASWQTANGTAGGLDADHDGDGVANGIEFFLGGAVSTAGTTPLPAPVPAGNSFSITWTKAADYPGTYGNGFRVETSDTLTGTWTTESAAPGGNVSVSGNQVTYTFPLPLTMPKFVRLRVTGP